MKTLREYQQDFVEHEKAVGRSPVYLRGLRYAELHLSAWLEQAHGVTHPEILIPQHLEAWQRHLNGRQTSRGLPLKPNSLCKQFNCDRAFLRWLARIGVTSADLAELAPRIKPSHRLPTSVLTHRQMMKLLQAVDRLTAEGHQLHAMLEFLYTSGVRVAELLGLDLHHLDLKNRQALVFGKGRKERMVPIGEVAAGVAESYLKAFRPLILRDPTVKAVWLNRQGVRMPYHTFRRQLLTVATRAGLPVHVTAHTFRRSFTTELIRNGANLWHVKEALGHESIETLSPYVKLTIPDLKRTLARCHPRERDHR